MMTVCIILSVLSLVGMIACVVTNAEIKKIPLYFVVTSIGAILTLCIGVLPWGEALKGLWNDSAVNPIKILVLFISMTAISVFLDEIGFFRYLASVTLKKAGISQLKLFILLFVVVSTLTVFTSNDIIVLTFTPFICYFCKRAKLNPLPYLIEEFVASNTFSMMLMIGNPTNIYLSLFQGITFGEYLSVMWLPALFGGAVSFVVMLLLFKKQLKKPIEAEYEDFSPNIPLMIIGLIHLAVCTIMLAVSQFVKLEMWIISFGFALSLFIVVTIYKLVKKQKPTEVVKTIKRLPWGLVPFMLSMFILVASLSYRGVTENIASLFENKGVFTYGIITTLCCNLLNNIPMSVLFGSILNFGSASTGAIYATVIGSNIGAFLTPIGALAGIMWIKILKGQEVKMTFLKFMSYGFIIAVPTLLASLLGLYIMV